MTNISKYPTVDITKQSELLKQYKDSKNLSTRVSIHEKYSVNPQGLGNWLYEHYTLREGDKILELGCGTGKLWIDNLEALPENVEIFLTDFSQGMIEEVIEMYKDVPYIQSSQMDVQNIEFEDNTFDIIIANFLLHHVPNIECALKEIQRVLKPGGKFYAAEFGEKHLQEINRWVREFDSNLNVFNSNEAPFRLENGRPILKQFFQEVEIDEYYDGLEVTDKTDLMEYISSMKHMSILPSEKICELTAYIEKKRNSDGVFKIQKQTGTFIASKPLSK